jgi:16S rRNA (guanine(966)-N(2))-methyltransferase RsmD
MRVIGGQARGHKLKQVPGDSTRPITDRVKESLFDILADWVIGTRWLDLFAGTGQVAIEALSRGARSATFVDNSRAAILTIRENLAQTKLTNLAEVRQQDAFDFLDSTSSAAYDVIYVAPPQYKDLWLEALQRLDREAESMLSVDGLVIAQIDPREFRVVELSKLALVDKRRYGNTMLCFYEPLEMTES